MGRQASLTNTILPFVYTIFSLCALSLVHDPLIVVGLAGYSATLEKDMVIVKTSCDRYYQLQRVDSGTLYQ
jgi:hypothetical protein